MAADAAQEIPPVLSLRGVGPALAGRLHKLGIVDLRDLLLHAPLRYEDRSHITPIVEADSGKVLIEGEILVCDVIGGRRPILVCRLRDGSGIMDLCFFHFNSALRHRLMPGTRWRCFGVVRSSARGKEMIHPELISADQVSGILPIYPATEGLSQKVLQRLLAQALTLLDPPPPWLPCVPVDCLPDGLDLRLTDALTRLHHPPPDSDCSALGEGHDPVQRRLAFEELLAHQLAFRDLSRCQSSMQAPPLTLDPNLSRQFLQRLPFNLTEAQQRAFSEIAADLNLRRPMGRLLQGDVGSGKTVVAAMTALTAWSGGWQTALMAPTELLADQHGQIWRNWLKPLGVRVALLTARQGGRERRQLLEAISRGEVDVVIGTHVLFQKEVRFNRLGVVVVDEQHRFGVNQRLALKSKAEKQIPHYLVMTATPIPRTLAMLRYGDLKLSVIDQLPPGRQPVETRVMREEKRGDLIDRLGEWIGGGGQAYWVCPLIEESEALAGEAAEKTAETLSHELAGVRIGLIHGRMKTEHKEAAMTAFKSGEVDLMVATTVVEVGVDVPNAGLMVIENAERLGLAQLHQLRGRVGRGSDRSYCILLYRSPLTDTARCRLACLRDCHDGFALAEKDLELRGPGEVLGTRQSGALRFKIANLVRDIDLLPQVREAATWLERHAPEHISPLRTFWLKQGEHYADV